MDKLLEQLCEEMHDRYEKAAIGTGWETNPESCKPWSDVPEANKATMRAAIGPIADRIAELEANYLNLEDNYLAALNSNRVLRPRNAELEAEIAECKRQFAAYILQQGEDDE